MALIRCHVPQMTLLYFQDALHTGVLFEAQHCRPIDMDDNCSIGTSTSSPIQIDPSSIKTQGISAIHNRFT